MLVPIIHGPAPGILLTKRTATLSSHAGQVAFPGGRIDPGEDAVTAAPCARPGRRSACRADLVEVTGPLPDYMTGTGFRITPVVGLLAPGFVPMPSAAEVEEVFELPMSVLLDPSAPEKRRAMWKGREREFWVWPHSRHYIWGATAAILVHLAAPAAGGRRLMLRASASCAAERSGAGSLLAAALLYGVWFRRLPSRRAVLGLCLAEMRARGRPDLVRHVGRPPPARDAMCRPRCTVMA